MGAVYIWMTGRETIQGVSDESVRFITNGQDPRGENCFHNAILMWNPQNISFPNNICPYEQRFSHGLEKIGKLECEVLGVTFIVLIDEDFESRRECCKVEQACQLQIHHLDLGYQRMHRVAGAGMPHSIGDGGRMIVGATYLPMNFFENNPNIVIVASCYN
jgi:hypothetical protein